MREYPAIGGKVEYNVPMNMSTAMHTLYGTVEGMFNVWGQDNVATTYHIEQAMEAACLVMNCHNDPAFVPRGAYNASTWLEEECLSQGPLPFDWTCSNRVNILVQECGMINAFVMFDAILNFPYPANASSPWGPQNDIIFYLCTELINVISSPTMIAMVMSHELNHVIQVNSKSYLFVMTNDIVILFSSSLLHSPATASA
jgi:hypothetical protein